MSGMFVWSLGASLAALLTGALNIVRAGRPDDRTVAMIATAGSFGWLLLCLAFGKSIGNYADPRALGNCIVAIGLLFFGLRTLSRARVPRFQSA